jgi:hypothetical protein
VAHLLFVDESGHDGKASPCAVLAGVSVRDRDFWNLVVASHQAELNRFGMRYTQGAHEIKAKKFLKTKVFRLAKSVPAIPDPERTEMAMKCLLDGASAGPVEQAALAQAKLDFVADILELCLRYRCQAFASIVKRDAPRPTGRGMLRKDYAFLFERFFYYLEDDGPESVGLIVFDELEKSQSHLLVGQMDTYFKQTETGRQRAARVIPEPFFVHSDLVTGVQIVDLVAYLLSWGYRLNSMNEPHRVELERYRDAISAMRYRATRDMCGKSDFGIWSLVYLDDLRPRNEIVPT